MHEPGETIVKYNCTKSIIVRAFNLNRMRGENQSQQVV